MFSTTDGKVIKYLCLFFTAALFSMCFVVIRITEKETIKAVKLPEEIAAAKAGDKMHCEIKNDTLYINFSKLGSQSTVTFK